MQEIKIGDRVAYEWNGDVIIGFVTSVSTNRYYTVRIPDYFKDDPYYKDSNKDAYAFVHDVQIIKNYNSITVATDNV